jgi:hypothetical protein
MKKIIALLLLIPALAKAEDIQFAWDYPASQMTNIVFKLYLSTSVPPVPASIQTFTPVATSTNITLVYTNTNPGMLTFFVTASNTVRQSESLPSNTVQLPATPFVPSNFRMISVTVRPQ